MDRIKLRGLRAWGHHGVLSQERRDGQEFIVDLTVELDLRPAARSDDLRNTVDYADLAARVIAAVERDPVDLVETVAARIIEQCWAYPAVRRAEVTVHKPQAPIAVPFGDVTIHLSRVRPRVAVFGLGANVGEAVTQLRVAARALAGDPGCRLVAASPIYVTAPWGGVEQDDFHNAVLLLDTDREAEDLLDLARRVEEDAGRTRERRWGPRTLDVDLITVGAEHRADAQLTLPHPRAAERAFVLAPWLDADPAAVLPGVGPVRDLLARLDDQQIRRTDDFLLPEEAR